MGIAASWDHWWRRSWWVEPCGRLFSAGVPRTGSKLLPPLPGMKAGAVRHALLHSSATVMRKCPEEKLREVTGYFRVTLSQPPSLDALAGLCQYRRHFAGVRIEVDYHDQMPAHGAITS